MVGWDERTLEKGRQVVVVVVVVVVVAVVVAGLAGGGCKKIKGQGRDQLKRRTTLEKRGGDRRVKSASRSILPRSSQCQCSKAMPASQLLAPACSPLCSVLF